MVTGGSGCNSLFALGYSKRKVFASLEYGSALKFEPRYSETLSTVCLSDTLNQTAVLFC